ncbi:hypothetical protein niasHT_027506 [Heterodera trifolii]|uniref:Uncharacterized protein n=1 Tax=Heterodera trifolii TaxID=157864 RepID=A0ABD2JMQ2_9BILA
MLVQMAQLCNDPGLSLEFVRKPQAAQKQDCRVPSTTCSPSRCSALLLFCSPPTSVPPLSLLMTSSRRHSPLLLTAAASPPAVPSSACDGRSHRQNATLNRCASVPPRRVSCRHRPAGLRRFIRRAPPCVQARLCALLAFGHEAAMAALCFGRADVRGRHKRKCSGERPAKQIRAFSVPVIRRAVPCTFMWQFPSELAVGQLNQFAPGGVKCSRSSFPSKYAEFNAMVASAGWHCPRAGATRARCFGCAKYEQFDRPYRQNSGAHICFAKHRQYSHPAMKKKEIWQFFLRSVGQSARPSKRKRSHNALVMPR